MLVIFSIISLPRAPPGYNDSGKSRDLSVPKRESTVENYIYRKEVSFCGVWITTSYSSIPFVSGLNCEVYVVCSAAFFFSA